MQRATFEPVNQGILAFCYDCTPHETGMATFRRLGIQPHCQVTRFVLPLRVDRQIRKRVGFISPLFTCVGNFLLWLYRRPRSSVRDVKISEHAGPFGREFSELDTAVHNPAVIRVRRSAAYLNWRYRQDPLQECRVLTARRNGELIGYIVFHVTSEDVTIVDLFGTEFPVVAIPLLESVVQCCESSHQTIEAYLSAESELVAPFLASRFRRRCVGAQVVAYAKPGGEVAAFLQTNPRWVLNGSDIQA
jgi:hypothetical protein